VGHPESRRMSIRSWSGSIGIGGIFALALAARAGVVSTPSIHQGPPSINPPVFGPSTVTGDQITLSDSSSDPTRLLDAHMGPGADNQWTLSSQITNQKNVLGIDEILIDPSAAFSPGPSQPLQMTTSGGDAATAIPLPPAVQSGITGIAALGLAGLFRSIRRALR
jgi:hypothetical protein